MGESPFRRQLLVACALVVLAGILFLLEGSPGEYREPARVAEARPALAALNEAVDTLLARYRIDRGWVKTWRVQTPDRKFLRVERRVFVPPDFISLNFNHDLSRAVQDFGATAVATERTKENIVTIHIKKDRTIIQSISLVTKRDLRKLAG
jgi:hypothetical protein